jgi:hypothetical protein
LFVSLTGAAFAQSAPLAWNGSTWLNQDLTAMAGQSFAQEKPVWVSDGTPASNQANQLPRAVPAPSPGPPPGGNLQTWSSFFTFGGNAYPFTMVGTNPTQAGAGTTNVPTIIIPLVFAFGNTFVTPTTSSCGDNVSVISRVQNSPLFTTGVTWTEGNTVVGVTQFTDAFQRANFWSYVNAISPNYHVLLNPVQTANPILVNVPANQGGLLGSACPGHPIGGVSKAYLDAVVVPQIIANLRIQPNTLPLFLTYDIADLLGGNAFFLGYHNVMGNGQTYAVSSYVDPGLLNLPVADISVLSHELGEWMDDPFGNNRVPPWGHVGQVQGCQADLEVGDPLSGTNSIVFTPGFNYHVQDLAFFSWFARLSPSIAVNGWYSTLNTFPSPPPVCQ